eukprot:gnl/MRDRNA2_/MRDRNA2_551896_c0_seq1.p1 gnl/MRDRNA2_/MRDRNA2_551896_c0~~gnl/MRDRNA2_/MRDRNA2_551896_c0_seq1.p1  ORF type:complete len:101 (-),score=18.01 gnl/MRDRNA2_/MRDRNA2_551896_c0_seq1:73-339(-)
MSRDVVSTPGGPSGIAENRASQTEQQNTRPTINESASRALRVLSAEWCGGTCSAKEMTASAEQKPQEATSARTDSSSSNFGPLVVEHI